MQESGIGTMGAQNGYVNSTTFLGSDTKNEQTLMILTHVRGYEGFHEI